MIEALDDRTPVIVGVGEASERVDDPDYSAASPVDLAERAVRAAMADARIPAREIDVVAGVRQFAISRATAIAPFGRSDNFPRSVARRIDAEPRRAVLEITGGQAPQKLVTEFAHAIAAGEAGTVLLTGAEAISTVRHLLDRGDHPDWSETVGGQLDDRGYGVEGLAGEALVSHGATRPLPLYALFENARRKRLGLSRESYRLEMGRLFAPFTRIAAANPHAMSRRVFSAEELAAVTPQNRITCDPFPRRVVSRDQTNQAAALLLTSVGRARALGVPQDRWVFLRGSADVRERPVIDRPDLSRSPAAVAAVRHSLAGAGVGIEEIGLIDLYSCFPIAVFNICEALGLQADDARGLTVTGGLPFFGGAGNNYSMHAIAEMARRLRAAPDQVGLVGANGGYMSKYSVGIYSASPAPWRAFSSAGLQHELDAAPTAPLADQGRGEALVETYTIDFDQPAPRVLAVARDPSGRRLVAATDQPAVVEAFGRSDPIGARIRVMPAEDGRNLVIGVS